MRSAPSVMMPQLTGAFGLTAAGLASLIGLFYYGYAPFSLVAGVAMDQLGPRKVVPLGAALVGVGALLFATGEPSLAGVGRFLQGAGGVFALIGAVYMATTYFPASRAATLIGATQMFGMAGGSAGQFLVGPAIAGGLFVERVLDRDGRRRCSDRRASVLPHSQKPTVCRVKAAAPSQSDWAQTGDRGVRRRVPQSAIHPVRADRRPDVPADDDLRHGLGRALPAGGPRPALFAGRAALGLRAVRLDHRLSAAGRCCRTGSAAASRSSPAARSCCSSCLVLILYGPPGLFPPYSLGLVAGIASGAAMLPYTVIKEANRPEHSGTATGVINFINFSLSALLGPVFGSLLMRVSGGGERELAHYQAAFQPLVFGVAAAIVLTLFLRETGPGKQRRRRASQARHLNGPRRSMQKEL